MVNEDPDPTELIDRAVIEARRRAREPEAVRPIEAADDLRIYPDPPESLRTYPPSPVDPSRFSADGSSILPSGLRVRRSGRGWWRSLLQSLSARHSLRLVSIWHYPN